MNSLKKEDEKEEAKVTWGHKVMVPNLF